MNQIAAPPSPATILSFDVEEHHRIEAAVGLSVADVQRNDYRRRAVDSTRRLLEILDRHKAVATFYLVGELARDEPALVREIDQRGHELASHGWDHRRVLDMTPDRFRTDLRQSKDILEQLTGKPVLGYRAPTFSITRRNPWAIDLLVEAGYLYDSSIYPVRHDRYGVPDAPRSAFRVQGETASILEIPPATLRIRRFLAPAGGGGYFRLFPLKIIDSAVRQTHHECRPAVAMLYFHPWEFDPGQPQLPLRRLSRFRTYVGIRQAAFRLEQLVQAHVDTLVPAGRVASSLMERVTDLPTFSLSSKPA